MLNNRGFIKWMILYTVKYFISNKNKIFKYALMLWGAVSVELCSPKSIYWSPQNVIFFGYRAITDAIN